MMAATGFAYAPNEALQARMAHLAAEGKLVLGDAQDARACLLEATLPNSACKAAIPRVQVRPNLFLHSRMPTVRPSPWC